MTISKQAETFQGIPCEILLKSGEIVSATSITTISVTVYGETQGEIRANVGTIEYTFQIEEINGIREPILPVEPIQRIKAAIQEIEKVTGEHVRSVQVPRAVALEMLKFNSADWKRVSGGWLSAEEIDNLLSTTWRNGTSALSGLSFHDTTIIVAENVQTDCDWIRISPGNL